MNLLGVLVVVVLGGLTGCVERRALDGEATGWGSLEFVGLVLAAFVLYLALSDLITARLSRRGRRKRYPVHRSLTETASPTPEPSDEALDSRQGVSAEAMR